MDFTHESIIVSIKKTLDSDAFSLLREEAGDLSMAIMIKDPAYVFTEPVDVENFIIIEGTRIPS